jgi:hypothetical protein
MVFLFRHQNLYPICCYSKFMKIVEIEKLPQVVEAAVVLRKLEERGIQEPAIAAGWTRALLTDETTSDIDVSYVGSVHYKDAQVILQQVLDELKPANRETWDVKGFGTPRLPMA